MKPWVGVLLLLGLPRLLMAQTTPPTLLAWEYDGPTVDSFTLEAVTSQQSPITVTVAPSAPGACAQIAGAKADTFCMQWPGCLGPGTWALTVQAVRGPLTSPPSDPYTCTITAARPCACVEVRTSPPPQTTTPVPTPPELTLTPVRATPVGKPLAGPDLLQEALKVTAPPVTIPAPT